MKTILLLVAFLCVSSLFAQENAVINDSKLIINIQDKKSVKIKKSKEVTVYNEDGYREGVYFDYRDDFRKITSASMLVMDSEGKKVKKLGRVDALDISSNQSFETTDTRYFILDPNYKSYPFSVRIEIEVELKGFLQLPVWMPLRSTRVGVKKSSLAVTTPSEYKLRMLQENIDDVVVTNEGGVTKYEWFVSSLEPVMEKLDSKTFYDRQSKVYLAPSDFELDGFSGNLDTWENFGDWYLDVNQGPNELGRDTEEFLDELGVPNDKVQLIDSLYKFMQNKTRYVSIQLGIGGFQSLPSILVDEKGYGDCKALTNYMKAMLDYKGISSNYVLVRAGKDAPTIKEKFPSNQFNHVFLAVPLEKDTVLLECTSQTSPPGYIGTFTDDRNVLWIEEGKSEIIKTPQYSSEENKIKSHAQIVLEENGNGSVNLNMEQSGSYFSDYGFYSAAPKSQIEQYNLKKFDYKDFTLTAFSFSQEEDEPTFSSEFSIEVKNLAKSTSSKLLLPINLLPSIETHVNSNRYTKFAEIRRGFTLEDKVEVEVPQSLWIYNIPEQILLDSEFGTYTINVDYEGEKLLIERKVVFNKGRYDEEAFDEFYKFLKKIKRSDATKLALESKT